MTIEPQRSASIAAGNASGSRDDAALRQSIAALPPAAGAQRLEALQDRVMAQWREAMAAAPALGSSVATGDTGTVHSGPGGATLGRRGSGPGVPRMVWLGLATAAICVAVGLKLWPQQRDPVLEELMKVDVLSQMSAGEM
jgi:hypothetical protein